MYTEIVLLVFSDPKIIILTYCHEWLQENIITSHKAPRALAFLSWEPHYGYLCGSSFGAWDVGFCVKLRHGEILNAEIWGIYLGLQLAWNKGVWRLLVESDTAIAVQLISYGPLIILLLLANLSLSHPLSMVYFEQAPSSCKQLLLSNISGVS
ncbi:hypothetical protein DVH24_028513 [Malus domestica]|uniref:RNase H type-1 domain-containing protein n=1 Tax=Malus domestica TaxID=3750 RepID=A0A498IZP4_MALDO|nr:hypothetical protein DVH24_028513 [Malus domestica]